MVAFAALLPTTALAANSCPAIGSSIFYGTCEPRTYCDRYDVISHSKVEGRWGFNARMYRRNSQGWYYIGNSWTICY